MTCWASRGWQLPLPPGWTKKESRSKVPQSHGKLSRHVKTESFMEVVLEFERRVVCQGQAEKLVFFLMLFFRDIGHRQWMALEC